MNTETVCRLADCGLPFLPRHPAQIFCTSSCYYEHREETENWTLELDPYLADAEKLHSLDWELLKRRTDGTVTTWGPALRLPVRENGRTSYVSIDDLSYEFLIAYVDQLKQKWG